MRATILSPRARSNASLTRGTRTGVCRRWEPTAPPVRLLRRRTTRREQDGHRHRRRAAHGGGVGGSPAVSAAAALLRRGIRRPVPAGRRFDRDRVRVDAAAGRGCLRARVARPGRCWRGAARPAGARRSRSGAGREDHRRPPGAVRDRHHPGDLRPSGPGAELPVHSVRQPARRRGPRRTGDLRFGASAARPRLDRHPPPQPPSRRLRLYCTANSRRAGCG